MTIIIALLVLAAYEIVRQMFQDDLIHGVSHVVWPAEYSINVWLDDPSSFHEDPLFINEHILHYDHADDLVIL